MSVLVCLISISSNNSNSSKYSDARFWDIQSIDTVKYSRDIAREKENDTSFDQTIDTQVRLISETGATHISIGTPYDEEFIPFIKRWVAAARRYDLNVWFRGNFSGWERWFGYDSISREEHIELTKNFILSNSDLFEEGDIFTSCPECENGGAGDPRRTRDIVGHRKFLIEEYKVSNDSFRKIGKNVRSNFFPMNGDVANLIMDKETTKALGGIVVVDHYVGNTQKLADDIVNLAEKSGGKVVLGEFGAPIPDIHGDLNEDEQAAWVGSAFDQLHNLDELVGVNYWAAYGSSTKLWEKDDTPRKVVEVITNYYSPKSISAVVTNEIGQPIPGAIVTAESRIAMTGSDGRFSLPVINSGPSLVVTADGYGNIVSQTEGKIVLKKNSENFFYRVRKIIHNII